MAGGEAIIKLYPGGPHGFIMFPPEMMENANKALEDTKKYIQSKMI